MFKLKFIKTISVLFLFSMACLASLSCSRDGQSSVYFLPATKTVQVHLDFGTTSATAASLKIYYLDEHGVRQSTNSTVDSNKNFSVTLTDEMMQDPGVSLGSETLVSMGGSLPTREIHGALAEKPLKVVHLEVIGGDGQSSGIVPYARFEIPLTRADVYSQSEKILALSSSTALLLRHVGMLAVQVRNSLGASVSGAKVTNYNLDSTSLDNSATSVPIWQVPAFRPVRSLSNNQGVAWVGPFYRDANTPRYQVVAEQETYCTYMTAPDYFPTSNFPTISMTLQRCEASTSTVPGIIPSITNKLNTMEESLSASQTITSYLTNTTTLSLSFAPFGALRGIRAQVIELNESLSELITVSDQLFTTFQSAATITTVDKFPSTSGTSGRFILRISPIFSPEDLSTYGPPSSTNFYFRKNVTKPLFNASVSDPLADTKVYGTAGTSGTRSVLQSGANETVHIESSRCGTGIMFGAILGAFNFAKPNFVACKGTGVDMPFSSLQSSGSTGSQMLKLYMRDAYGNQSDDVADLTLITVSVTANAQ